MNDKLTIFAGQNTRRRAMRNLSLYIDLAFCFIVLPVMVMIFPVERWLHNFPWYIASVGTWLYGLYFLNRFVTVPCLFGRRRAAGVGIALIVVSFAVTFCLSRISLYTPRPSIFDQGIGRVLPYTQPYQQAVWALFMIVEAFSFAVGLLTQANLQRARRRAVEAEREKARLELYKARIKPHFMFNTLNSLYGLFLTRSDKALPSLEKFISMMRYIHISSASDLVPLSDEITYISQYVALQRLRLTGMTSVSLDIDTGAPQLSLPPMLLITFVENCFKHGVSSVEPSSIDISIRVRGTQLVFTTRNRIFPVPRIGEHMGIDNCRRRLGIMYPGRHTLSASPDGAGCFIVKLTIDLK